MVHDLLAAQACDTDNPCIHTDYPNDFEKIYDFYQGLTEAEYDWLTAPAQDELRELLTELLLSDPGANVNTFLQQYRLVFGGLVPQLELDPVVDGAWLMEHPEVANEVGSYLENHGLEYQESAEEGVKLYLNLLRNSDLEDFNAEFAAIPSFLWPFIKEVGLELAIELFKRNFPGANLPNSLLDAVNALAQGDILTLCGEIIDIVKIAAKNAGLPLKAINLVWDGVDLGVEASKAWKVLSRMEQFGGEVIEKTLLVVKNQAGGILGKLKWKKGVGAEMTGINNPEQFWDDLENLFPFATKLPLDQLAQYEIAGFTINGTGAGVIRFSIKFGGGTNPDGYTLEIKLGNSPPLKFRFF